MGWIRGRDPSITGPNTIPGGLDSALGRLNKVGYDCLRKILFELPNVDLKFWKKFDKDFIDEFIWKFISLSSGEHLTKNERTELDYFLLKKYDSLYEKWLELAVKLDVRKEDAKKMLN